MKFIVRKEINTKNFVLEEVSIPEGTELESIGNVIYYNGIPLCLTSSQLTKDFMIWNDDGNYDDRLYYENIILFSPRMRVWEDTEEEYDFNGNITGSHPIVRNARFSPTEVSHIKEHWEDLVEKDSVLRFNKKFFIGSTIEDIKALGEYLISSN